MTAYFGLYRLSLVGLLVPAVALTARRLHDTGRSGWYALLGLIPVAGWIILLVLSIGDTKPEAERLGRHARLGHRATAGRSRPAPGPPRNVSGPR